MSSPSPRALDDACSRGLVEALGPLFDVARGEPGLAARLRTSLRDYCIRTANAPRCADLAGGPETRVPAFVGRLNEAALADTPVTSDDVHAPALRPRATEHLFWTSAKSIEILTSVQSLRQRREEAHPGDDVVAWKIDYGRVLDRLRSWKAEEEPDRIAYLCEASECYATLVRLAVDEPTRAETLDDFVRVVVGARSDELGEPVWLCVSSVVGRLPRNDVDGVLDRLVASGDPTLSAYASFQRRGIDVMALGSNPDPGDAAPGSER